MFRRSLSRALNVPFSGYACALQEGDRVVVVQEHPYWDAKSGVIVRLKTHRPVDGTPTRVAVILPSYDGITRLTAQSPELTDAWVVPVNLLRLHLLAFERILRLGDRVRVVAGAYRHRRAHVIGVEFGTVRLRLLPPPSNLNPIESPAIDLELPMRLVAADFRCGDVVRVIRGPHKGKTGLVVDIHIGGWITLYQTEMHTGKLVLVPQGLRQREDDLLLRAPDPLEPKIDDIELDLQEALTAERLVPFHDDDGTPSPVLPIPTNFVAFERFDHSDVQVQSESEDPWAALEVRRKQRRQEMKDSERWLQGMEVQVVGKHPLKGLRGIILGYRWLTTRPQRHLPADYGQVELQINIDQHTTWNTVSFKSVVELSSHLPLDQAVIVKDTQDILSFQPRPATPRPPPTPRPITPRPPHHPCYEVYGEPPVIEDINGKWLLEPSFVRKRIDILVTDSEGFDFLVRRFSRLAERIRKPQRDVADQIGYLVPLEKPVTEPQIEKDLIAVNINNKRIMLPIAALTPCRTTPGGQPISAVRGRVIIIGPDVVGSQARMGQYAEVIPGQSRWPDLVVMVKFLPERDRWGQVIRVTEKYHIASLCRAHNVPIGPLQATNFDG
ncbi:hypothetical protein C8F01DRAFT_557744 [Mycena amicta]|nr:hypothetical protein C8F01DRAFT_557744 [Mycena amicta]